MFKKILFLLLLSCNVFAAWTPISNDLPQYQDANGDNCSGCVLKFYAAGTSTPIVFATDSAGGTTAASIALNSSGYPEVSGNEVIPHIDQGYKLVLYPNQTAADANSGGTWSIDNIATGAAAVAEWQDSGLTPTFVSTTQFTYSGDQTTINHVGRRLEITDSGGTDYCTITASSYSDPSTTITASCDSSGILDSGISTVSYSILSAVNHSFPLLDEDTLASDSATLPASQQSVKAYVNNKISEVGDLTQSMRTSKTGWLLLDGDTIGNSSSGATHAIDATYDDLYTLLWTNCANSECAVSSGRGASAAADLAANKTLTLPNASGRSLRGKDDMSGSSAGVNTHAQADLLGGKEGAETHTLVESEMPAHDHSYSDFRISGAVNHATGANVGFAGVTDTTGSTGGDAAHENMSPYLTINTFIKY